MSAMISTRTVTINAAFLQEIKDVNERLWQTLRSLEEMCREPTATTPFLRVVGRAMSELRDQLALHFSLEEAFGYFDDPIETAPHICDCAELLRGQHQELYLICCDLVERLEQAYDRGQNGQAFVLAESCLEFHVRLADHEEAEIALIQEAYANDIGVGD